jgi:type 2 lantibiotic biosynthesis protein LanM
MPAPSASPAAPAVRLGLLLGEHLDLPVDPDVPVDPAAAARLDDAVRSWLSGPGELPGTLADRPPADLSGPPAGRLVPSAAPGEPARAWLAAAVRAGTPAPVESPDLDLAPWQTAILGLLSPAYDVARRSALHDLDGLAARGCAEWLRTPPVALLRLLTGAFVLDMDAARSLPAAPSDVDDWFLHHLAALSTPDGRVAFLDRYPLLGRLAGEILLGWRDAAAEFGRRLAADAAALTSLLGVPSLELLGVRAGLGDAHGHGRTVACVRFAEGRVAYKPRPLAAARALAFADVAVPAFVDRGTHGWMSWVEPAPVADRAAAARYYRRLGRLNAAAWLLGAYDLHSENIVAAGDTPYLVDVETLLTPVPRHEETGHTHAAAGALLESPASTGILPFSLDLGDGHSADLSAYGDRPGQLGAEVSTWDAAGTGDMHLVRRRLPQADPPSVPRYADGTPVDALEFRDSVAEGSAELLASLAGFSPAAVPDPGRTRVLLRDTARYGEVTEFLRHPAVLHEPFLADAAFEPLLDPAVHPDPEVRRAVVAAERAALLRGDVPHFEVAPDGTDLFCCDGTVIPGFFAASPLSRVASRADRLATERAALDWATTASLRVAQLNRDRARRKVVCCSSPAAAPAAPATLVETATAIADRLAALACRDAGETSWLTLRVDLAEQWRVVVADDSLYLGTAGVLLFLSALPSPSPAVSALRTSLHEQWRRRSLSGGHGPGLYTGSAGDLLVALRLGETAHARSLADRLGEPAEDLDLFSGAAGLVLALTRAGLPEAAEPHVRRLLSAQDPAGWWDTTGAGPLLGFAHGSSGIAYALGEHAAAGGPLAAGCRAAVAAAMRWESSLFDDATCSWPDLRPLPGTETGSASWCNGAAGIGLARAAALRRGDPGAADLRLDVERAVAASLAHGLGLGQGPCHGDLGVAETLLLAAGACDRPEWTETAGRIAAAVAGSVVDGLVTLEFGPGVDLPGLVNGAAGVGYQLLRVADPDRVPSVLAP